MGGEMQVVELENGAGVSRKGEGISRLAEMCLKAACESQQSVQVWRKQIRTLERLPVHLAHPLFHRLLRSGLLNPPLLELFQYSMVEIILSGESSVDTEWTAYLKNFQFLQIIEAANCRSLSNFAISQLKGLETLQELNISYCSKITDEGLAHLLSLTNLKKLGLAETRVTAKGLASLSALKSLTSLDLGGLPVTDSVLFSLMELTGLQHLDIWGSGVSDQGVLHLKGFSSLQHLNLAWTEVTRVPPLQFLKHLNMAKCTIASIFEGWKGAEGTLEVLHLSGSNILVPGEVLGCVWISNVSTIDLSSTNLKDFGVMGGMKKIEIMDLSGTVVQDFAMGIIATIGMNLKHLDLSGCKVTSAGIGALAGYVPKLQTLALSGTLVDDSVFSFLQLMPTLQIIDLSYTNVKGFIMEENGKASKYFSIAALEHLSFLRVFNLRNTLISDKSCLGLLCLPELTHLHLRSELLSDSSLQSLSLLKNLLTLSFEGAMVTDSGLLSFTLPPLLKELSLLDCWLLTKKGILQFCEAHPDLTVRHGHLSSVFGSLKGTPLKEAKTKGSLNSKGVNAGKTKSPAVSNAQPLDHQRSKESLGMLFDERIKFSRSDLLRMREVQQNSEQVHHANLGYLPPLLSSVQELAGLLKVESIQQSRHAE